MKKTRVLFLCTGNSCRSQMAEGLLRTLGGEQFDACSAGAKPTGHVHPLAIKAMAEVDIDLSNHTSKSLDVFDGQKFDCLITVCDHAREACPTYAGAKNQLHWNFDDPAHASGSEEQKLAVFRRVRDEIRARVEEFVHTAPHPDPLPANGTRRRNNRNG
ncbi:MAG TPA: arsenate reductase ArsC [Verrucomicrobiae bacterium]|nr:arsenate reductase ArsC [Verrucomicrobiae bacterium]